jgi:hypothetical protein
LTFNAAIEQDVAFPGPVRPADFTAIDWQIGASRKASLAKLFIPFPRTDGKLSRFFRHDLPPDSQTPI